MLKSYVISGGGEALSQFPDFGSEDQSLIVDMGDQIRAAGGPALAMRLMEQRRILEDSLRFKKWIEESRLMSMATVEAENQNSAAEIDGLDQERQNQSLMLLRRASYRAAM